MLSDLFTRIFNNGQSASDEEAEDPGFTAFMETLHARRANEDWFMPGPEGDLYRQRCRDEEMMRMESRNYGFKINPASVCSKETEDGGPLQQKRPRRPSFLRKYSFSSFPDKPKRVSSLGS